MEFWIIAGIICALVAGLLALTALRQRGAGVVSGARIQIYRDQLSEVDRDEARGVLNTEEAGRLRLEVSRRLLDADNIAQEVQASSGANSPVLAWLMVILLFGGGYALYSRLGVPGYADLPLNARIAAADETRATRPSQAVVEAETPSQSLEASADPAHLDLMEKLRAALVERPDELQGHLLLAENEAVLGNFAAAQLAQEQVLRIKGGGATAQDYADYVDLLALAAGGYVSPRGEAAIGKVLELQPSNGTGRYYLGLMYAQTGRPDLAFRLWRELLENTSPNAPWVPPIRAQIEIAAQEAGVRYTLPELAPIAPIAPGPTQGDVDAAASMTQAERDDMVQSMVSRLSDRLATDGGPPEDWARLISALGVLGQVETARSVWDEAARVFADDPDGLAAVTAAARQAGVAN